MHARVLTSSAVAVLVAFTACVGQTPATTATGSPTAAAQQATPTPATTTAAPTTAAPATTAAAAATTPTPAPTPTPTPPPMPRGRVEPKLVVDVYDPVSVWPGTTLLPFQDDLQNPRIIEVNALGEVVWEYLIPQDLKRFTNPGFDAELLPNNNVLFLLPGNGVYEIDRSGRIIWSYLTRKISHDADRLPNGNTIFVFGKNDTKNDPQVVEVNSRGEVVWAWYARDHFDRPPYGDISNEGWTHTNTVQRLPNGNTLISLRNFHFVVEVDRQGAVVRTIGEGILENPHDPVQLSTGNLLVGSSGRPGRAVEIDGATGQVVWQFAFRYPLTPGPRDANRLPNGNTLITGLSVIVEVTPQGRVVWQLRLSRTFQSVDEARNLGFYKADRIGISP